MLVFLVQAILIGLFAAPASLAERSTGFEVDGKIALSEQGFQKMKAIFQKSGLEISFRPRQDFSFDAYSIENKAFLLETTNNKVKYRLKVKLSKKRRKIKEGELQISKKLRGIHRQCFEQTVKVARKHYEEIEIGKSEVVTVQNMIRQSFKALKEQDLLGYNVVNYQLKNQHDFLVSPLGRFANSFIEDKLKTATNYLFVASVAVKSKEQWKIYPSVGGRAIEFKLIETRDLDQQGHMQTRWQMEVEPSDETQWSLDEVAGALCKFMRDSGETWSAADFPQPGQGKGGGDELMLELLGRHFSRSK